MRSGRAELVFLVEDDPLARSLARRLLEEAGYSVAEFAEGRQAIESPLTPSAVCLDLGLGDMPGIDVIQHLCAHHPDLPIIVVTAQADVETAVAAMRSGAYDFVTKPFDRHRLVASVARAIERRTLAQKVEKLTSELFEKAPFRAIIGTSMPIRRVAEQIERVKDSEVAIAIFGESGTGKELAARAIHAASRRRSGPFVAVNCAAIPESLHESELFGHDKGAFTGAVGVHKGRFEQANAGTLFLDEIGEMSLATQAVLLRTIEEHKVRRLGGHDEISVDVRIICATNRDLHKEVQAGRFREDLYYRLVVYPLLLPPLRERADDVPLLVAHFLEKHRADVGGEIHRVSSEALEALSRHAWPGNVRELENAIHRAMLASDGGEIQLGHLPPDVQAALLPRLPPRTGLQTADLLPLAELERRAIDKALQVSEGSVEKAAKLLGMGRATLYRRLGSVTRITRGG